MSENKKILVAAEDVDNATVVCDLLRKEFDQVLVSTDPERAVEDFEIHRPAVLVLAFTSLAQAQTYYLGLYRLGTQAHAHSHRTLLLCNKAELQTVYALCKKGHFSSYVLFWPLGYDSTRLGMEVHHALQQVADTEADAPTSSEFAAQGRRIAGLEALLELSLAQGSQKIEVGRQALEQAGDDIRLALEGFAHRFSVEAHKDLLEGGGPVGESVLNLLQSEFARLKSEYVDRHLHSVTQAIEPISHWADQFKKDLAPGLESMHELRKLTESRRPLVLVVDDDEFQHKLIQRLLASFGVELMFALSSQDALTCIHRRRPELIFMDIGLPDLSGIETTRRLKAMKPFASIPVIMITGHSKKDVVVGSLKAGACDFVVKPFDKAVLLKKVSTLLHLG